jgi:phage terminase Nu1 subunit (DNA packaging protein)
MEAEDKRWNAYISQNPKVKIKIENKYLHENREVVTSRYLQQIWGVTDRTIRNYIKEGMPVSDISSSKFKIFDLIECINWRMSQIDMSKSNVSKATQKENETESGEESVAKANRDKIIADAKKAIHEANVSEMKEKNMRDELISADDVDKAMAEQAVIHKTDIINSEKILPLILEDKSSAEITQELVGHNSERIKELNKLIKKEFDCDETLFEIIQEVIEELKKSNPSKIIEKIKSKKN